MIDIIIPVYNSLDTLKVALDSISKQINLSNLNVYIIDDYSVCQYEPLIDDYKSKMNINYFKLNQNFGPGVARQKGIELSSGEYIIFLDSDDIFYNEKSIFILYDSVMNSNADVVRSIIYEETDDGFISYEHENIGLHGKIYKRKFLVDNNIYFNDKRSNEDVGFNALIELCDAKYFDIDEVTYIWCNNKKSITRSNIEDYKNVDIENYAYNLYWAIKESIRRNKFSQFFCIKYLIYMYNKVQNTQDIETVEKVKEFGKNICGLLEFNSKISIEEIIKNESKNVENFENIMNYFLLKNEDKNGFYVANDSMFEYKNRLYHIDLMNQYNNLNCYATNKYELLNLMLAQIGEYSQITPPIQSNWGGKNLYLGVGCYINFNFFINDDANIYIGNKTIIGPNVNINTVNHPININERLKNKIKAQKVKIGDNVWIGAGVIILPGITIGDNSVIGAGSVVTKDIPSNVVAVGNPCRVIKKIDTSDK